jgi:hypothetical protein
MLYFISNMNIEIIFLHNLYEQNLTFIQQIVVTIFN